jgi:phospholipid/cholesterol/gamma-HCH transport system ATP-binding protein
MRRSGFGIHADPRIELPDYRDGVRLMAEPKILLTDVVKAFGGNRVLDGMTLAIEPGESLAIIGQSGSGKSVTLKCILGLLRPDSGSIKVDGTEVTGLTGAALDRLRAKFGMLFQGSALFDSLPIWRNVTFALTQGRRVDVAHMRKIAEENLERVGLDRRVLNLRPNELSGGMQKRVALARAIAARPEIIFFDEPTTGLDPIRADVINDLIVSLVDDLGVTALTITHDMASARKIAHRVAMLYQGKIIWRGPRDRLYDSGNPYVDQFVQGRAEGPIQ